METLLESKGTALLLEFFLKSSLVLGIALSLSFLLRKQSASLRHFLLGLSLVGLLVLPFLTAFMPGWQTALLPSWGTAPPGQLVIDIPSHHGELASATIAPLNRDHARAKQFKVSAGEKTAAPGPGWLNPLYRYGVTALWCLAAGILLVRILLGLYGALRLTRRGIPLKGYPWQQLFQWFSTRPLMSLQRKVRLVKSKGITVPMTWGVLKPVVLLPPSSSQWPLDQCSSVLFHELSHVKRWDFLVALLCRISCCLYWFNPLSWMVFKRLRTEQEKACDEMVLKTGIKPSTYASSLLSLKQAIDNKHYRPIPVLGMASSSQLHERLTSILAKQIKIKEIKMKTKMMFLILMVLAVALIGTARPNQPFSAVTKETAVASETDAQEEQSAEQKQTVQTKEVEKKKEKAKKKEKKATIIIKNGEKDKVWSISEVINGKETILSLFKDEKNIKYEIISDGIILITGKKDNGKNFYIYKKGKEKKGEGGHYLVIEEGEQKDEKGHETVKIDMLEKGDQYIVIFDKDSEGKGQRVKIEILSDNEINEELLEKIEKMAKELQQSLPTSYKLETELSKTSQSITFVWPLELDKKAHKEALKHFSAFSEELQELLTPVKGSKPIKKRITISPKEKDTEI